MTDFSLPLPAPSKHELALAMLKEAVVSVVRTASQGLSEMALLKTLQSPPWQVLDPVDFSSPTALYPPHFLVFHVLHHWRHELHQEGLETLEIGPLHIQLRPLIQPRGQQLDSHDALAAFYLDLDNLNLSQESIEGMVDNFWRGVQPPGNEALESACATLAVDCPPPSLAIVRGQFRRLAMRHHPDRGGSTQQLQSLNEAMAVVRHYFR
ncbi:MAG: molecular chaperone DnaJ [Halomonadaceae bacterium]|nr:MAG: molecular chaperone DnaJ [Halomonadaceae bacterium]